MESTNNNPLKNGQGEDKDFKTQAKTILLFFMENTATASMASKETGIPHKNICRIKRDLELSGKLWEIEKKTCKVTGYRAWYLTTNPEHKPPTAQLTLF